MPALPFSQALTANQRGFNPLTGWQFERVPNSWGRAAVKILLRTTGAAGTVQVTITTGSTTIQQRAPMSVGGTAGVQPTDFNTPSVEFLADPDDKIAMQIDETAGATPTVDGIVVIERAA
jgi:hypothetical protein